MKNNEHKNIDNCIIESGLIIKSINPSSKNLLGDGESGLIKAKGAECKHYSS
jgi:hypothetical protein